MDKTCTRKESVQSLPGIQQLLNANSYDLFSFILRQIPSEIPLTYICMAFRVLPWKIAEVRKISLDFSFARQKSVHFTDVGKSLFLKRHDIFFLSIMHANLQQTGAFYVAEGGAEAAARCARARA